ncbi:MAG: MBL fold metallo-hydrolase [Gemmataceae bacterium]|nr:MBL fold metallo-hydrolase [Gemmataceae bacterium]
MDNHHAAPSVTFWGAARTVTGSMHLVRAGGLQVLLDCGLFQGKRSEARQRNTTFPFSPATIDAVVLSHAHIDHCGNLPNLVRQGFDGPIYCTAATRDLLAVMLADSAKIQEEDAGYLNKKRGAGEPPVLPLYAPRDVQSTMRLVQSVPYLRPCEIAGQITFRFLEAGHLLGSAMIHLTVPGTPRDRTITFTGDLGRRGLPILRDPAAVPPADLLITECTYGGRVHAPVHRLADDFAEVVRRTVARGGKIIVPAFSLGRTQNIVYFLHLLVNQGKLAKLPIFVDSPLAVRATEVFRLHPECFDEETWDLLQRDADLFGGYLVHYVHSVEESKALNHHRDPCLIISASGMCETGRILHHLKNNIEDPRNTVLIIGFQAPETLGRRLVEKRPEVRIHDKMYPLRAEVVVMNGFSCHADRDDFSAFLGPLAGQVGKTRLVHGEADQATALVQLLEGKGFRDAGYPERGETVVLE